MSGESERLSEEDWAQRTAELGIEVEAFLRSPVGQYLEDRVNVDLENLTRELVLADPEDAAENRRLRSEIAVRNQIMMYLSEAVQSGRIAHGQLREMETFTDS